MNSTAAGFFILILAALMNGGFTLPMKFTRRWAWENTWLAWTLLTLVALPLLITWLSVPHLRDVYRSTASGTLIEVIGFGAGWGVSQVLMGLAVDAIGIALAFSLVLGISAAVGTLVPLLLLHPERLNTPAGHGLLAGVGLVLLGVLACAVAGRLREKRLNTTAAERKNMSAGLTLAVLSGLGAAFMNLGLTFGAPLAASARFYSASAFSASNVVWMPLLLAGAVPNLIYCLWLLTKNRTVSKFPAGGIGHWVLAFTMAVCWFGSTILYGLSTVEMGSWGPILGWPMFMSLIVITASVQGLVTGEWKRSGSFPLRMQWAGVALLLSAVFLIATASRSLS